MLSALIDLLPGRGVDERAQALQKLQTWVSIARPLTASDGSSLESAALSAHVATLSAVAAHELSLAAHPESPDHLFRQIEAIRRLAESPTKDWPQIRRQLEELQRSIAALLRKRRVLGALVTATRVAIYAGPLVLAYLVGTYFRFNNDVFLQSELVERPLGAYRTSSDRYTIDADYQKRFFEQFSRFYFRRANSFEKEVWQGAVNDRAPVRLRVVFRNPRAAESLLVALVDVAATAHHVPFEWSRVDVTADVRVEPDLSAGGISLQDEGIGPSVHVTYRLYGNGIDIQTGSFDQLFHRTASLSYDSVDRDVAVVRVAVDDPDRVTSPLFIGLVTPRSGAGEPEPVRQNVVRCADGRMFEHIETVTRLAQLTATVRGNASLEVEFESLRGNPQKQTVEVPLPVSHVYARRLAGWNEQRDPCAEGGVLVTSPGLGLATAPPLPALVDALVAATPRLEGVDLIKTSLARAPS